MTDACERGQQDPASFIDTTGFSDEEILASLGSTRKDIACYLKQNAIEETPDLLNTLLCRMVGAARQAIIDELSESVQIASFPEGLTERQAQTLRNRVVHEIDASETLRRYFGRCCSIEIEPIGRHIYQVHGYFFLYGRDYGELFLSDGASWDDCVAQIRCEQEEEERA